MKTTSEEIEKNPEGKRWSAIGKGILLVLLVIIGVASLFPMHEWSEQMARSHIEDVRVIWYAMFTWFLLPIPTIVVCVILGRKKRVFAMIMCIAVSVWLMASGYALNSGKCETCEHIREIY